MESLKNKQTKNPQTFPSFNYIQVAVLLKHKIKFPISYHLFINVNEQLTSFLS